MSAALCDSPKAWVLRKTCSRDLFQEGNYALNMPNLYRWFFSLYRSVSWFQFGPPLGVPRLCEIHLFSLLASFKQIWSDTAGRAGRSWRSVLSLVANSPQPVWGFFCVVQAKPQPLWWLLCTRCWSKWVPTRQDRVEHPFFLSFLPGGGVQGDLCAISSRSTPPELGRSLLAFSLEVSQD